MRRTYFWGRSCVTSIRKNRAMSYFPIRPYFWGNMVPFFWPWIFEGGKIKIKLINFNSTSLKWFSLFKYNIFHKECLFSYKFIPFSINKQNVQCTSFMLKSCPMPPLISCIWKPTFSLKIFYRKKNVRM